MHAGPVATRRRRPAAAVVAAVWVTAACSGAAGGPDAPAGGPTPSTTATSPSATPSAALSATATSPSATPSASAAGAGVPPGAGTATTVDLDGDGAPDTLWLADVGGARTLGVTTTAHGTSSVVFQSAAPESASASAAVLATGAPVVLLDTGRSVQVYGYRVDGPGLVVVPDREGAQYSFSLGFADVGTGLACERRADGLHLYGEDATSDASGTAWTVTRTEVVVHLDRPSAVNGATTTVGVGLSAVDPAVRAARGTTCGPDAAVAAEPG